MSKLVDLTGQKFGRLTVLYRIKNNYNNCHAKWHCQCSCGKEINFNSDKLKSGHTKSCGCLKLEFQKNGGANKTHGVSKTRLYAIWAGMITRCSNPNRAKAKKDYQDRGITVCTEWHKFEAFQEWALANGYAEKLSIERINNNKGYSPDNCKWADAKTQANNRTTFCKYFTFNGETLTISQWADKIGIKYSTLYQRLLNGWAINKALYTPVETRRAA